MSLKTNFFTHKQKGVWPLGCVELWNYKVEITDRLKLFGFFLLSTTPKCSDYQLCCSSKDDRLKWLKFVEPFSVSPLSKVKTFPHIP